MDVFPQDNHEDLVRWSLLWLHVGVSLEASHSSVSRGRVSAIRADGGVLQLLAVAIPRGMGTKRHEGGGGAQKTQELCRVVSWVGLADRSGWLLGKSRRLCSTPTDMRAVLVIVSSSSQLLRRERESARGARGAASRFCLPRLPLMHGRAGAFRGMSSCSGQFIKMRLTEPMRYSDWRIETSAIINNGWPPETRP